MNHGIASEIVSSVLCGCCVDVCAWQLTDEQLALRELEAEWKKAAKPVVLSPVIPTTANVVTSDEEGDLEPSSGGEVEDEGVTEGDLETVARAANEQRASEAASTASDAAPATTSQNDKLKLEID